MLLPREKSSNTFLFFLSKKNIFSIITNFTEYYGIKLQTFIIPGHRRQPGDHHMFATQGNTTSETKK